jgi:hypothetical protein
MGELWADLTLALALMVMVYIVQWAIAGTGSRKVGIILGLLVAYLTVFQHAEILYLVVLFFFGYAFFAVFEGVWIGPPKERG